MSRNHKVLAWVLSICLTITLIPEMGFAASTSSKPSETPAISPDEVTEDDVVEKTEDITTYDLGKGQKMTVFHGGAVRYKNNQGKLIDYDPSLVKGKAGGKSEQALPLDGYAYENKSGGL